MCVFFTLLFAFIQPLESIEKVKNKVSFGLQFTHILNIQYYYEHF